MPETAPDIAAPETRDENALDLGYTVSVEAFSGPLDLLLFLVRKTELDIVDIPVAAIADQFVSLVSEWQREGTLDLEAAGDFILMAATLLEIKARTIAPPPLEEGEKPADDEDDILDPRTDLIGKLLAYRKFKEAVGLLVEREAERALHVTRQFREDIPEDPDEAAGIDLGELQVAELSKYWYTLLARIGGGGPRTVMKDDIPIEGSIRKLAERAEQERELSLRQLFAAESALQGRVTMLMATLECTRQRIVQVTQVEQYADAQLRFRPVEDRAIVPVVFPPEEGGKKRRRRPPLVTFQAPVAPSSDELEEATEQPEEKHETDEERFLRELNEACDLDGVLGRVHDVEKGFQQYWETLHPPEPKPVVEPPAAIVAEPVPVPEARIESPLPPAEVPIPVAAVEAPAAVVEQPVVATSGVPAVETAPVAAAEPAPDAAVALVDGPAPTVTEPVVAEAAPVEALAQPAGEPVVSETVPSETAVAAEVLEPVAAELAPVALAEPQGSTIEPGVEPVAEAVPAIEPVAEPIVAAVEASGPPAEPVTVESVAVESEAVAPADVAPPVASEPELTAPPVEPEAVAGIEPVIAEELPVESSTAAIVEEPAAIEAAPVAEDPPVIEAAPIVEEPPAAVVTETMAEPAAEAPPIEDAPAEPPVALVRDLVPEVRVEIAHEELEPAAETIPAVAEAVPPETVEVPVAVVVTVANRPEPLAEPTAAAGEPVAVAAVEQPVEALPSIEPIPVHAVVEPAAPVVAVARTEAALEPQTEPIPAAIAEPLAVHVAAPQSVAEESHDAPPAAAAIPVPVIETAIPAVAAIPQAEVPPSPVPERRPRWSRTLLLLLAGSAGAALAGWWMLRIQPEPLPIAMTAPAPIEPTPSAVAPEPHPAPSAPVVAPASAAQLDGLRLAPSPELQALIEGPATQWMGRVELPIAVPWYACAPLPETPASVFAFVQPPVLAGVPLMAFAREGAWAWCAAGAWVPPRMRVLPASAFVPPIAPPADLVAWAAAPDFAGIPAEIFLQPGGWAVCAGRPAAAIALQPPVHLAESAPVEATAAPEPAASDVP